MLNLTKAQQLSLIRAYTRRLDPRCPETGKHESYLGFRRRAQPGPDNCVMVFTSGYWLGIETDGYAHT